MNLDGGKLIMTTKTYPRRRLEHTKKINSALVVLLGGLFILSGWFWFQGQPNELKLLPASFSQKANQVLQQHQKEPKLTLLLQKDERWGKLAYGLEDNDNDIAHNGCALASLAMIDGYWRQETPDLKRILDWSQNRYYVKGQGTAWQIFADFAKEYGYQYENLGNHYNHAKELMNQGIPVIVSVGPGTFTTSGHLLVLATDNQGHLRTYDPNDDPEKKHYEKNWPRETFLNEAVNYWALWWA